MTADQSLWPPALLAASLLALALALGVRLLVLRRRRPPGPPLCDEAAIPTVERPSTRGQGPAE